MSINRVPQIKISPLSMKIFARYGNIANGGTLTNRLQNRKRNRNTFLRFVYADISKSVSEVAYKPGFKLAHV
ncbi:hypothetical protein SAMN05428988_5064 [Chitinophaga sp. YR573]|nr:hypothetical protein SAMN05428988_5064 [Chitinophaga sp. YR573]